jgi:hypothetical protein
VLSSAGRRVAPHFQPLTSEAYRAKCPTITEVWVAGKHGLDVDDGSAFDGADAQAILDHLAHGDGMKADGIWAVGRARGEYASKLTARV